MVNPCEMAPPARLTEAWKASGSIPDAAHWTPQTGGHSNPVWRVRDGRQDLICKLYHVEKSSPLFGNDPKHEAIALTKLEGQGVAPNLVATLDTPAGPSLIYRYLSGPQWCGNVVEVAHLLAKLHRQPVPHGLPSAPSAPEGLLHQTRLMHPSPSALSDSLRSITLPKLPAIAPVFLHGDVVPGNLVETRSGLQLIDWQCPAIGDPCLDIAIFLSPAMQIIYGHRPLTAPEIQTFFDAYGQPEVTQRYLALAPVFHLRMAAYCAWKGARGSQAHAAAEVVEHRAMSLVSSALSEQR